MFFGVRRATYLIEFCFMAQCWSVSCMDETKRRVLSYQ